MRWALWTHLERKQVNLQGYDMQQNKNIVKQANIPGAGITAESLVAIRVDMKILLGKHKTMGRYVAAEIHILCKFNYIS